MTNTNGGGEIPGGDSTNPNLGVITQYTKDFSFENPNAPSSLMQQQQQPQIGIQINVNPRQLSPTDYEVELKLEGKAELNGNVLFAFDLNYAGRVSPGEHPTGQCRSAADDRMSAAVVPVCARDRRDRHLQRRLSAIVAASNRFRGALSAPPCRNAGRSAADPGRVRRFRILSKVAAGGARFRGPASRAILIRSIELDDRTAALA